MSRTGKMLCAVVALAVSVGAIPWLSRLSRGQAPPPGQAKTPAAILPASTVPADRAPVEPSDASAEEAILQKLQEPAEFSFKDVPLKEAMEFLAKKHKLPIVINKTALAAAGVADDAAVSETVKALPLEWALNRLLRPRNLAWLVRSEVLDITTKEDADAFLVARVYPVADLVVPKRSVVMENPPDYESLMDLIKSAIRAESWRDAGGPGTLERAALTLVISQTPAIHREVAVLVAGLRAAGKVADHKRAPRPAVFGCYDRKTEERVAELLRRRVSIAIDGASLEELAQAWSKEHGLEIVLDRAELNSVAVDPAKTMLAVRKDMSLRSALELALREHNLSWIVRDGALVITSQENADTSLVVCVYPVADLLPADGEVVLGPDGSSARADDNSESLIQTIVNTVAPASWKDAGGPGAAKFEENTSSIVVSQTRQVQERVERLLAELREHGTRPKTSAKTKPAPPPPRDDEIVLRAYGIPAESSVRAKVAEQAATIIQELVAPETWKARDTPAFLRVWPDRLVIRQTAKVHREIQKLLQDLDLLAPPISGPPPAPPPKDE